MVKWQTSHFALSQGFELVKAENVNMSKKLKKKSSISLWGFLEQLF
jgi:hypothetical protein